MRVFARSRIGLSFSGQMLHFVQHDRSKTRSNEFERATRWCGAAALLGVVAHGTILAMKRLYWTHPDVFEAEVEVVAVGPGKVTIDPILFHPDEGGQPADKGTIGEAVVHDVQVVDGKIVHTLDRPLTDGRYVACLDKERRLYTATQHTAQHILSGVAASQFGLETVGVYIGLEGCTVDFDKKLEWDVAEEIERRAMEVVTLDIPVETTFNDPDMQTGSRRGESLCRGLPARDPKAGRLRHRKAKPALSLPNGMAWPQMRRRFEAGSWRRPKAGWRPS
jgi:hypothetical protein